MYRGYKVVKIHFYRENGQQNEHRWHKSSWRISRRYTRLPTYLNPSNEENTGMIDNLYRRHYILKCLAAQVNCDAHHTPYNKIVKISQLNNSHNVIALLKKMFFVISRAVLLECKTTTRVSQSWKIQ